MPNPTNSIARGIASDLSATEQSAIRSAIGFEPEQSLAVWGASPIPLNASIVGLVYHSGTDRVVALTDDNSVFIGEAVAGGISWGSEISLPITVVTTSNISHTIASNGNTIVVAGSSSGTGAYSSDGGNNWTSTNLGTSSQVRQLKYANGLFLGLGNNNKYVKSADGINWTEITTSNMSASPENLYYSETFGAWYASYNVSSGTSYRLCKNSALTGNWTILVDGATRYTGPIFDYDDGIAFISDSETTSVSLDGSTLTSLPPLLNGSQLDANNLYATKGVTVSIGSASVSSYASTKESVFCKNTVR